MSSTDSARRSPRKPAAPTSQAKAPPKIAALLAACPLFPDPVDGRCAACSGALPKGRRRWCSSTCAAKWQNNHIWSVARRVARRRDRYRCTKCRVRGRKRGETEGPRLEVNHRTSIASLAVGKRELPSCAHHLENLETLCSVCHAAVTREQAADRATRRRTAAASA